MRHIRCIRILEEFDAQADKIDGLYLVESPLINKQFRSMLFLNLALNIPNLAPKIRSLCVGSGALPQTVLQRLSEQGMRTLDLLYVVTLLQPCHSWDVPELTVNEIRVHVSSCSGLFPLPACRKLVLLDHVPSACEGRRSLTRQYLISELQRVGCKISIRARKADWMRKDGQWIAGAEEEWRVWEEFAERVEMV